MNSSCVTVKDMAGYRSSNCFAKFSGGFVTPTRSPEPSLFTPTDASWTPRPCQYPRSSSMTFFWYSRSSA